MHTNQVDIILWINLQQSRKPKKIKIKKTEPQMSRSVEDPEKASPQSSPHQVPVTDEQIEEIKQEVEIELEDSYTPDHEPLQSTQMTTTKSDFQIKMEERRSEILRQKQKLAQCMYFILFLYLSYNYPCT